jgi:toxin ParE1/3/4
MAEVRITTPAELDIVALWAHIAKDNIAAADRMVERLDATIRRLGQYPKLGEVFRSRDREFRKFVVASHVLVYRYDADNVIVVRILHSAQQWEELL